MLVFLLIALPDFLSGGTKKPNSGSSRPPVTVSNQVTIDEGRHGKIHIESPRVDNVPDYINDTLRSYIANEVHEFRFQAREAELARRQYENQSGQSSGGVPASDIVLDLSRYSLYINYEKGEIDSHFVSLIFQVDEYVGGAHGVKSLQPFNYDLIKYEGVTLSDLFPQDNGYLNRLSDYCMPELRTELTLADSSYVPDEKWLAEGAGPIAKNYRNFTFNQDVVTIYFGYYQIAPYSFGQFRVDVPRRLIRMQ